MKKLFPIVFLFLLSCKTTEQIQSPRAQYQQLFDTIQMSRVFPDNKTFVDAIPLEKPKQILKTYREVKNDEAFNLKTFTEKYFEIPTAHQADFKTNNSDLRQHIDTLWKVLARKADTATVGSLIPLPYPYIVPGGRFREVYYWDSYFTMLGLKESGRVETIQNMLNNFAYLLNRFGFIPNGNRTYYLTRSQPPFFALMVDLLAQLKGDNVYTEYQDELLKEYQFWMRGATNMNTGDADKNAVKLAGGEILNRYWDDSDQPREESFFEDVNAAKETQQPKAAFYRNIRAAAESGWDFSSRWFADGENLASIQTTEIIPVDLNCLLYFLEKTIAKSYKVQKNATAEKKYLNIAERRKNAILKYNWDASHGWFKDYNFVNQSFTKSWNLAAMFPMFVNIASTEQAEQLSKNLEEKFLKFGGLISTLSNTGQQWDAPNGWAPLQYISIQGLKNYQKQQLAKNIAERWINLNKNVFKQTGKLMEKYNVADADASAGGGEYPLQDGFGWTNGVLLNLMNSYNK